MRRKIRGKIIGWLRGDKVTVMNVRCRDGTNERIEMPTDEVETTLSELRLDWNDLCGNTFCGYI